MIETYIHRRALVGSTYIALAVLLADTAARLPGDFVSQLNRLVAQADPAERENAITQAETAITALPINEAAAGQLRHALRLSDGNEGPGS